MTRPYTLDELEVAECHCENAVEHLFKAYAEDPKGDNRSMWLPHENPYLTAHVEAVTLRLSTILERIMDALAEILLGQPLGQVLGKALVPWLRWSPEEFERVRARLEDKPPELFTREDWLLVAEYLIQRYLPDGVIQEEAEYLAVRAWLLGKIQAAYSNPAPPPPDMMQAWATLTPASFAHVPPRLLSNLELGMLGIAKDRAALNISNVTERARAGMKGLILEHVQAQLLGQKEGTNRHLATRLFDNFGVLNRDFRRIAVSEAGDCCLQGFIAARPIGSYVIRREAYHNACKFCRSLDGQKFRVVAPDDPDRRPWEDVWVGKSNVGRSAAPRDRAGNERAPDDRWWPAAGIQHPHCRGVWLPAPDAPVGADPVFLKWMEDMVATHRGETLASAI